MSVTLNPTANQNPFSDSNWNQSNAASASVNSSGQILQLSNSTANFITYSGAMGATQSASAALTGNVGAYDAFAVGNGPVVLYTDASNHARFGAIHQGTDNNDVVLFVRISGSDTPFSFVTGVADNWFVDGDVIKLEVAWSGADATFTLRKNGTIVGSTITRTSFALTSGKAGVLSERNEFDRQLRIGQVIITGESGGGGSSEAPPRRVTLQMGPP